MRDSCDCRSHPQIAAPSLDHGTLLGLLADPRAHPVLPPAQRDAIGTAVAEASR